MDSEFVSFEFPPHDAPAEWRIEEAMVRVGKPFLASTGDFACRFQILGMGFGDKVRCVCGIDARQSLQLTLRMLSDLLTAESATEDSRC